MNASAPTLLRTNRNHDVPIDAIDLALIEQLQHDGRMSAEELSARVSLSRPAVVARMKRLRESGVIKQYTAIVDWEALGFPILAYIQVRTSRQCREQARVFVGMSDGSAVVEECHRTTGEWCLLAKVRAKTASALEALIDRIRDEDNVEQTMTTLALSTMAAR